MNEVGTMEFQRYTNFFITLLCFGNIKNSNVEKKRKNKR